LAHIDGCGTSTSSGGVIYINCSENLADEIRNSLMTVQQISYSYTEVMS